MYGQLALSRSITRQRPAAWEALAVLMTMSNWNRDTRFGLPEGSVDFVDALGQDLLEFWTFSLGSDPYVALSVDSYIYTVNELYMIATPQSAVTAVATFVRRTLGELGLLETRHGGNVLRYTLVRQDFG